VKAITIHLLSIALISLYSSGFAKKPAVDWKQILVSDTLDVFLEGNRVGELFSGFVFDGAAIESHVKMSVEQAGTLMVGVFEKRRYNSEGNLTSAYQEMKSPSGTTSWSLEQSKPGTWYSTVITAGVENKRQVEPAHDNLYTMYAIYEQIKNATLKVGDVWIDSVVELTSGDLVVNTTRCSESPYENGGSKWVLLTRNSLQGKEERMELDKQGKTLFREVAPFIAVKKGNSIPASTVSSSGVTNLFEAFSVRVSKSPKPGSVISLLLDSSVTIDSSVSSMYVHHDSTYVLSALPCSCTDTAMFISDTLKHYLQPTATLQIDHPEIVALVKKLNRHAGACETIKSYTDHVYKMLAKRNTATFSSALETLRAGYGDCGEHSVLLAALLRASGIPARIVMGLVYLDAKKGYFGHAWVMAYTGNKWMFTDPALGVTDACHDRIPLLIDDSGQKMVRLVRLPGKIRIQID
jgi:hypothetical protein